MKILSTLLSSLVLFFALAGSALASETVNINTADAATLERVLVNIGPAKAQAIVDYRKANGAFRSPEQLAMVKGIGLKTVEKNRDRISVGGARPLAPAAQQASAKPVVKAATKPVQVVRR
ncbi:ComEA family DNA-binding protein [Thermomonas haemolytica]|uniref:Competence protein ComEA n=1 Tax=Thermomonas haemolytica TaxID=141949 RepID=A0A4V2V1U2_9GAMM|nr:ComEA family DNA-binding protein [Thermomonas haemolytica]TCT22512.1 competence protein ComEA [Thermomonas haemolytica]TNY29240.1 competence protein ComEA [Thermomonas haemolytica]